MILLALVLLLTPLPAAAQTPAATPASALQADALQACSAVDETSIQDELNRVTQAVFADALNRVDIQAIVDEQWQTLALDRVVAQAVDDAADSVRNDTDVWRTFLSGWSGEQARALTLDVASRAFGAEPFRKAMDGLSAGVANEVATQMGALTAESSSAALYCLQTFIQGNYSPALLAVFQDKVSVATGAPPVNGDDIGPNVLDIIGAHTLALGGVGVIIAAQVAKRIVVELAETISERVAGGVVRRVLGRVGSDLIPLVGWVVGAGLIAYDIWNSADGALPQIRDSLKSPEVTAGIRTEIADAIREELGPELPQVARDVADDLYSQWTGVKRDIRVVLELAGQDEAFRAVLATIETPAQLQKLVSVSGALIAASGRQAVLDAAQSGALQRALATSADLAPIIAATGSLDTALDWLTAAGEQLDDVIRLEIYKQKQPADLDRATLQRLVALDNPQAVADLALLPNDQMAVLLALSSQSLRDLTASFTPEQLGWLAQTLQAMTLDDRNALVSRLVSNPALMAQLQATNLIDILQPGADLDAALGFMGDSRDALGIARDAWAVAAGAPTAAMFQAKYGTGTSLLVTLIGLLIMLIALRLLWAAALWLLEPVLALGRVGRRRQPAPPANRPPEPPRETLTYGPRPTNPPAPPPARERDPDAP